MANPALVQQKSSSFTSSFSAAFTSSVTAGSLLVLINTSGSSSGNTAVSDNQGNTWASATSINSNSIVFLEIWYAPNANAGSTTVNVTNANSGGWIISEFSGVATTTPLDKTATNSNATGTAITTGTTATTTQAVELSIAAGGVLSNKTVGSPINSYTALTGNTNTATSVFGAFLVPSTTGAQSSGWTSSASAVWAGAIATFKAAAATTVVIPDNTFAFLTDDFSLDDGTHSAWYGGGEGFPLIVTLTTVIASMLALALPGIADAASATAGGGAPQQAQPNLLSAVAAVVAAAFSVKGAPKQTGSAHATSAGATSAKAQPKLTDSVLAQASGSASTKAQPKLLSTVAAAISARASLKGQPKLIDSASVAAGGSAAAKGQPKISAGSLVIAHAAAAMTAAGKLTASVAAAAKAASALKASLIVVASARATAFAIASVKTTPIIVIGGVARLSASITAKAASFKVIASGAVFQTVNAAATMTLSAAHLLGAAVAKALPSGSIQSQPKTTDAAKVGAAGVTNIIAQPKLTAGLSAIAKAASAIKAASAMTLTPLVRIVPAATAKLTTLAVRASGIVTGAIVATANFTLTSLRTAAGSSAAASGQTPIKAQPKTSVSSAVRAASTALALKAITSVNLGPLVKLTGSTTAKLQSLAVKTSATVFQTVAAAASIALHSLRLNSASASAARPSASMKAQPQTALSGSITARAASAVKALPSSVTNSFVRVTGAAVAKASSLAQTVSGFVFQVVSSSATITLHALGAKFGPGVAAKPQSPITGTPKLAGSSHAGVVGAASVKAQSQIATSMRVRLGAAFTTSAAGLSIAARAVWRSLARIVPEFVLMRLRTPETLQAITQSSATIRAITQSPEIIILKTEE